MTKYHMKKCERETIININDAENVASLSTSQQWMKNKIKKLAEKRPGEVEIIENDEYILFAKFPKKWIRISPTRVVSEEQRMKAAERLKKYHEDKSGKINEDTDTDFSMDLEDEDTEDDTEEGYDANEETEE